MADIAETTANAADSAKKGASGFKSLMTKSAGPLPLWVWITLIVGGLGVVYFVRMRNGGVTAPLSSDSTDSDASGTGSGPGSGVLGSAGVVPVQSVGDNSGTSTPVILTNDQWEQQGLAYLTAKGVNSTAATNALNKYLAGQSLSSSEQTYVTMVVTYLGAPPLTTPSTGTDTTGDMNAWKQKAYDWLTAHGTYGAPITSQIVDDFVSGKQLNYGEGTWITQLINAIGWSPSGVQAINTTNADQAGYAPGGSHYRTWSAAGAQWALSKSNATYYTKAGDTLSSLSQSFYGKPDWWRTIYNANSKIVSASQYGKLKAGIKFTIPWNHG